MKFIQSPSITNLSKEQASFFYIVYFDKNNNIDYFENLNKFRKGGQKTTI